MPFIILAILGLCISYILICFIVAAIMPRMLMEAKGANRRSFETVRQEQTALGHVDYNAYDNMKKQPFLLKCEGADIAGEFIYPLIEAPKGDRPKCLIRVHGYTQNRLISVRFMAVFQRMGYAVAIYDQRGFGDSTGICSMGYHEKYDLVKVIDYIKEVMGQDTIIAVHGESMGGITAMEALAIDKRINFLVEDGGATDMEKFSEFELKRRTKLPPFPTKPLANFFMKQRYGFTFKDVCPIARVQNARIPILFLHGSADEEMPPEMCRELYEAAKHPLSRMVMFEGAKHCQGHAREPERYEQIIHDFIQDAEKSLIK